MAGAEPAFRVGAAFPRPVARMNVPADGGPAHDRAGCIANGEDVIEHPNARAGLEVSEADFDLALTLPDNGALRPFRIGFTGAPCGEIFMDMGADGGLGCQADGSGRGGVVALKKAEVKINSFYTFTVAIDYAKHAYDFSITGQKRDGTPFRHEAKDVAFESKTKAVSSLYIIAGSAVTAYLGAIAIQSE